MQRFERVGKRSVAARDKRRLIRWLLIARLYFISFLRLNGPVGGSGGFDGHVSLLVLIGASYSGQCVLMRKPRGVVALLVLVEFSWLLKI